MHIEPFKLERYFAQYEFAATHHLCASDCQSLTVGDLLDLAPGAAREFNGLWLGYTESRGHPLLREQIAELYEDAGIDAACVLVHTGAEEAIFNLMNVVLEAGDHLIVHYPCYQSLMQVARSIGCDISLWKAEAAGDWALDLAWLKREIRPATKLVVVNCPHNPTGYLMPPDQFEELAALSRRHGFVVFSDEVYRLLEYDARHRLPGMCELDDRAVSLGVMSKSLGLAGLRIGWIATRNRRIYDGMAGFKDYTSICNSAPSEFLSVIALQHRQRLLKRNLRIIRGNLDLLDPFFERNRDRLEWVRPKAGPIAFPAYRGGDVDRFCRELFEQTGVLLLPGTLYGSFNGHFRIGFGRQDFPEGLHRLESHIQHQRSMP
jgi:aspartate/methionine/tyrosine aminotransferase